jgi:hypothetical protein
MLGVTIRKNRIYSTDNQTTLDIVGALAFEVINKGSKSVLINDVEIEGYDSQCFPEFNNRVYCEELQLQFAETSASQFVEVIIYKPIQKECC